MKSKSEKRTTAKKNAEAVKAKKKTARTAKKSADASIGITAKKGKSAIGQSKKKK